MNENERKIYNKIKENSCKYRETKMEFRKFVYDLILNIIEEENVNIQGKFKVEQNTIINSHSHKNIAYLQDFIFSKEFSRMIKNIENNYILENLEELKKSLLGIIEEYNIGIQKGVAKNLEPYYIKKFENYYFCLQDPSFTIIVYLYDSCKEKKKVYETTSNDMIQTVNPEETFYYDDILDLDKLEKMKYLRFLEEAQDEMKKKSIEYNDILEETRDNFKEFIISNGLSKS